jgi:DNA polymerase III subunit gamma/tau
VSAPEQQTRTPGLALYRKYRSATFAEVVGQEHVTGPLSAALDAGRINHAYLFSGPRGCGKTSSARILARSLNCVQGPTATPCGVCDSCRELAPNGPGSIDVIEIDAASHGGVDDARELRERAFYAPVRDRFKVYIIDEAHMVSAQGFNALLKLVEEPPDFLVFVFATTEPDKVLQTIRSRTHHYPFRLLPPSAMRKHLEHICTAEGVTVEPTVLPLVVRAGAGSARDALSILDQLLAGAGPDGVTYADAVALLGVTDSGLLDDMVDALAAGDAKAVYATVDRVVEAGHDPRRFAADLLERLRDLLVLDAVPDAATNGLLDLPADALARMSEQSSRIGRAAGVRYAEILHAALIEMRGTTAPRLVLELVCARMLLPDASADSAALLQRLERLERRNELLDGGGPEPPPVADQLPIATTPPPQARPRSAPPKQESAKQEPAPDHGGQARTENALDAADLRRIWPDVLERVKQVNRTTRALLETTQVTSVDGAAVTLSISTEPLSRLLSTEANLEVITGAISSLIAGAWRVNVVVAGAAEPKSTAAATAAAEESDPREDDSQAHAGAHSAEDAALALLADELGAQPMPSEQ